jgi:AAA+ ATPase superfamily predicted ATPase
MENPFKYGVVVDDPYFINREKELREINLDLVSGNNLIISSPRRYGKTSLIQKVLHQLEIQGYPVVYLDFFRIADMKQFMDSYASQVLTKQKGLKSMLNIFQKWIRGVRPAISIDAAGNPSFTFSHDPAVSAYDSLTDILNLPLKISTEKRWIIVFDEFQDIEKFNGYETEKWFRSVMQFHDRVSYVLMGSKTHLLNQMFAHRDRAFYGFGKLMRIDKIDPQVMSDFIIERTRQTGISCDTAAAEAIISLAENIPYFIQFLASESWLFAYQNKIPVNQAAIEKAVQNILNNQSDYFHQLIDPFSSYQKKVLGALAQDTEQIFSHAYMKKYDLGAVSSTQRAVESLINMGILERDEEQVYFSNPFFKKYIQTRMKH